MLQQLFDITHWCGEDRNTGRERQPTAGGWSEPEAARDDSCSPGTVYPSAATPAGTVEGGVGEGEEYNECVECISILTDLQCSVKISD